MIGACCEVTKEGPGHRIRAAGTAALLLPPVVGVTASLVLISLYMGIITLAQDWQHARSLLWDDRYFVSAIAAGFGTQIGLYMYLRQVLHRRRWGASTAVTAAGTGTSTVAMVACCAHHVADVLPLVGLSGLAIFLNDYRLPLMTTGLAINSVGIAVVLRIVAKERRRLPLQRTGQKERGVA